MRTSLILATALTLLATPVAGQFDGPASSDARLALAVGARGLLDLDQGHPTLGVEARLSLPWPGFLQLRGAYDFTFLDGLTERTFLLDALITSGGLAFGGGPVVRNTQLQPQAPRENIEGWSAVVALGGDPRADGWSSLGVELRFMFVDAFETRTVGATFGLPLF